MRRFLPLLVASCAALQPSGPGCVRRMAVHALADELSSGAGASMGSDDDLKLVGEAIPFGLKLMESLREAAPDHVGLHAALASGFTRYAAVYVQFPAEQARFDDFAAWELGAGRARRLYLRARGYGLAGLELVEPGFLSDDRARRTLALERVGRDEVPLLYWTGAAWLAAISLSKDDPELLGQVPDAAALVHRALALDEAYDHGAVHELLVSLEPALPEPGGAERARGHFERAVALGGGRRASPYVSLAEAVSVPAQDRAEFASLLDQALQVDADASPPDRLANLYAQARARHLLRHADDLFVDPEK